MNNNIFVKDNTGRFSPIRITERKTSKVNKTDVSYTKELISKKLKNRCLFIKFSPHSKERMQKREVQNVDIMEALKNGQIKESKDKFVVCTKVSSRKDYPLQVVFTLNHNKVLVVSSVYWKGLEDYYY